MSRTNILVLFPPPPPPPAYIVPILFPDESLPKEVTVDAGQSAYFHCLARTTELTDGPLTVAFLVLSPDSHDLMECLNCSFSPTELTLCNEVVDEGSCSDLQFSSSSFGSPNLLTHNLTAHWGQVDTHQSGYEVVCAIAAQGVIQWAHTATLNVIPTTHTVTSTALTSTTPTVTPTSDDTRETVQGLSEREVVSIIASGVVVVVVSIGIVCTLGLILWYRHRHMKNSKISATKPEENEMLRYSEKIELN